MKDIKNSVIKKIFKSKLLWRYPPKELLEFKLWGGYTPIDKVNKEMGNYIKTRLASPFYCDLSQFIKKFQYISC